MSIRHLWMAAGLRYAFLLTLPVLAISGLVLLIALRAYAPAVAAALASTEQGARGHGCRRPYGKVAPSPGLTRPDLVTLIVS